MRFARVGLRTGLDQLREAGAFRLRMQRGGACVGVLVNTGGGIVAGDMLRQQIVAEPGARVTLTSVAAEKIYRSDGPIAAISMAATLGADAGLDWLPQETILFAGARLSRSFRLDLAATSRVLALESLVFGRLARGETSISGTFEDNWHIYRDGRLVLADRARLDGPIGALLDRPAIGGGARAVAMMLLAGPDAAAAIDPLRAALQPFADTVESGVSHRDGVTLVRALARSPERLRAAMMAALCVVRTAPLPRTWC